MFAARALLVVWLSACWFVQLAFTVPATAEAPVLGQLVAAPGAQACSLVSRPVVVDLNDVRTPATVLHVRDAVRAGQPRELHLDRVNADAHRALSLRGIATAPGKDRDEYPPAASAEGGAGADVRLIPSGDNRSAGSTMRAQLAPFCEGQRFIIEEGLP